MRNCSSRDTCAKTIRGQILHPYLRAAFAFLATVGNTGGPSLRTYRTVLFHVDVPLRVRVAFAVRFLPVTELNNFLHQCSVRCLAQGEIDGVLLTGLHTAAGMYVSG